MAFWSKSSKTPQPPPAQSPPPRPKGAQAKPAAAAVAQATAVDLQKSKAASARLLLRFGEVVSVLMRAPEFQQLKLAELQPLVVPPLVSGQFLVAEAQSKSNGFITPVAAALWAKVSKEVDQRLSRDLDKPIKLAASEWKSGDIAWLVALAGNPQAIGPMLKQFQQT